MSQEPTPLAAPGLLERNRCGVCHRLLADPFDRDYGGTSSMEVCFSCDPPMMVCRGCLPDHRGHRERAATGPDPAPQAEVATGPGSPPLPPEQEVALDGAAVAVLEVARIFGLESTIAWPVAMEVRALVRDRILRLLPPPAGIAG